VRKSLFFVTLVVALVGYQLMPSHASSHREAPLIASDPQADTTDVYAFVSPDDPNTVTLISSWIPFEDPQGGPNFYRFGDNVLYEFKIDNTGDGVEDITYQFRFTTQLKNPNTFLYNTGPILSLDDANRNMFQTYTVTRIDNGRTTLTAGPMLTMYDNVGPASAPEYGGHGSGIYAFNDTGGTSAVFAGQTDDPFFLDLRVFDLLYGANLSEAGVDSLAGFNVHSLALRVPKAALRSAASPIIGVWATASRPTTTTRAPGTETGTGAFVQVSRLGMPLVNEVVIPVGQKDKWNGSKPSDDGQFGSYVTDPEVPKLLQAIYKIPAPAAPRNDLVSVFLTGVAGLNQPPGVKPAEMLRLNTDIVPTANPARLGVLAGDIAGFPNGRRLTDDVVDITLQAAVGVLGGVKTSLGDGVNVNDVAFRRSFPYLAPAHSGGNPWKLNPNPLTGQ
jgi:hypothetical protein